MFKSTNRKGFHIILPNGITISTQFGAGSYCDNRYLDIIGTMNEDAECLNAELGIWTEDGFWITDEIMEKFGEDYVGPVWADVDIEKWLKILDICRDFK